MPRPAVLFGGPSPEHDVSILTGLQAALALANAGTDVTAIYWEKGGDFYAVDPTLEAQEFADGRPPKAQRVRLELGAPGGFVGEGGGLGRKARPIEISAVVNACHGGPGEDGTLQAALDLAGVRYTGPSVAGAALGMDKLAFAAVTLAAGLAHVPVVAVDQGSAAAGQPAPDFDGPFIVKPRFGGSSIGIEVFDSWDSVLAFVSSPQPNLRTGAVVEPFRPSADDLEVAVRRHPELRLSELSKPAKESSAIYDYRSKYVPGEGMTAAAREFPANVPDAVANSARAAVETVAHVAQVRGVARVDFLLVDDELFVNEINTVPGSLSKHLWEGSGVTYAQLLLDMIDEATSGPGRAYSTQGADGTILRSAASIASKLG